jgi:hypothetical protein
MKQALSRAALPLPHWLSSHFFSFVPAGALQKKFRELTLASFYACCCLFHKMIAFLIP